MSSPNDRKDGIDTNSDLTQEFVSDEGKAGDSGTHRPDSTPRMVSDTVTQAGSTAPDGVGPVSSTSDEKPRPSLPGYEILSEIGRGGMGVVYMARQVRLNRLVALKMILAGEHASPESRQRFLTEAETIARLHHPGIVQVYDFGTHQGHPHFALEYLPGGGLDAKLKGTPMSPMEAAALIQKLAEAVQAAHDLGIVHRDLKPANILLTEKGEPKIADFGLAKTSGHSDLTATGVILGTPSYMAPEQAGGKGKTAGPAADIYALGAIFYECLTGRPPFKEGTPVETLMKVVNQEPESLCIRQPQLPRDLETLCLKCLRKEPGDRFATARELAEECDRFLRREPIRTKPQGNPRNTRSWYKRHATALVVGAGVCVAVVVLLAALFLYLALSFDNRGIAPLNLKQAADRASQALPPVVGSPLPTSPSADKTSGDGGQPSIRSDVSGRDNAVGGHAPKAPGQEKIFIDYVKFNVTLTALVDDLDKGDRVKRLKAAEGLRDLGERAKIAIPSLIRRLNDSDDLTRVTVRAALTAIGPPYRSSVGKLGEILRDTAETNVEPRRYAAATLEKMGPDAKPAMNDLLRATDDEDSQVRQSAARALGRLGRDAKEFAKGPLEKMLEAPDRDSRMAAAEGLANLYGSTGDMDSLRKLIKNADPDIGTSSVKALAKLGKSAKPVLPELLELARNDKGDVRKSTLHVLAALDPAEAKPGLQLACEAVIDGDVKAKKESLKIFGMLAKEVQPATVDAIFEAAKTAELKTAARDCLSKVAQANRGGPAGKRALAGLVEFVKESENLGDAEMKVIGDLGPDALPALEGLIRRMDIQGERISQADEARISKCAAIIGKIGKAAVPRLRQGLGSQRIVKWGCAKALGEIGPDAVAAVNDLLDLAQREANVNPWMVKDIEEAIAKIQGK